MKSRPEVKVKTGGRIAGIARSTEAVSIGLLAAIDGTVDAMTGITQIMSGFSKVLLQVLEEIEAAKVKESSYIDPEDETIDVLGRSADQLKEFLATLVRKRAAIDCDCRLNDHHCESLHDAYGQAIEEVAFLVEGVQNVRSAIISHDLKAEPRNTEVFETVDALIANLRTK